MGHPIADPKAWIGVDLDGTLAEYVDGATVETIGKPIPAMVARVQGWLREGTIVKIFTARVGPATNAECQEVGYASQWHFILAQRALIRDWTLIVFGQVLEATAEKDYHMIALWDDRAIQVTPNTGLKISEVCDQALGQLREQLGQAEREIARLAQALADCRIARVGVLTSDLQT